MRQRTLPEQRELLRGLGQTRPAAEPTRPGAAPDAGRGAIGGRPAKTGATAAPRDKTAP